MKFQLFFISIVLFLIQNSTAQDFKTDWNAFTSEKYTLDFTTNSTTYYGTDTLGEMHCKLNAEPSKCILYSNEIKRWKSFKIFLVKMKSCITALT